VAKAKIVIIIYLKHCKSATAAKHEGGEGVIAYYNGHQQVDENAAKEQLAIC
jgi:hypothetical protein